MIAFIAFFIVVVVMATLDPHKVEEGKSQALLAKASYPKVYVHFVGGAALAGLLDPFLGDEVWLLLAVMFLGAMYEGMQWMNIRGTKRGGVFTVAEAIAVALGGLVYVGVRLVAR